MNPNMEQQLMIKNIGYIGLRLCTFIMVIAVMSVETLVAQDLTPEEIRALSEATQKVVRQLDGVVTNEGKKKPPKVDPDKVRANEIEALRQRLKELQQEEINESDAIEAELKVLRAAQEANKLEDDKVENKRDDVFIDETINPTADPTGKENFGGEVYGFSYIKGRNVKLFESAIDVKPPDNYVLGPGDEISVNIWGYSAYNQVFTIAKEGFIQPRFVGRVYVKGLTVADARKLLANKFEKIYDLDNSQFDITINYSRVILVNVVGEVLNPGAYTVPAINSAFNILAHVGGPSNIGSIRNVQIKRDGVIVDRFDLYRYLFFPEKQQDIFMQHNDYLFVPLAQKIVKITGDVKRPGRYEMLDKETFKDLLVYAAGYTPTSYTRSVQVKRYADNQVYIFDVDLDSLHHVDGVLPLMNGDEVRIRKIPVEVNNYLEIEGPVALPGLYEFRENMKVSDLVIEAGGFKVDIYQEVGYVSRTKSDFTKTTLKLDLAAILANPGGAEDIILKKRDKIEFFSSTYFYDSYGVSIHGAVRAPRSFNLQKDMSVRDLIMMAGGLEQFAYLERGYISRKNMNDNSISYLSFPIDTSNNLISLDAYLLEENDEVSILSNLEFIRDDRVKIEGAVKNPGTFELWQELSLKDLILLAGGLIETSYLQRAYVYRKYDNLDEEIIPIPLDTSNNLAALDEFILQRNDIIKIFSTANYFESFPVEVNGFVRDPGLFIYRENMTLADALILGGGLKFAASNHRVEVARISNFEESVSEDTPLKVEIIQLDITVDLTQDPIANEFLLRPFDQVFVRETPGFDFQEKVYLGGEVKYPGLYVLKSKNEKITSLIERAGGLTEYAFTAGARLERVDRNMGNVLMDLEMAMRRPKSKFNYILREGDAMTIPRLQDLVSITGTIAYPYIDTDSTINVAFSKGKRAKYYVKNYATGFTRKSKKRDTYVVYANGRVKETKHFFGIKFYPKVETGATVHVPQKFKRRDQKEPREGERNFDAMRFTEILLSSATTALTMYLLIDNNNP